MSLVRSCATAILALLLCFAYRSDGGTGFSLECPDDVAAASPAPSDDALKTGAGLAPPTPMPRAWNEAYKARLYCAELARAKRWGS